VAEEPQDPVQEFMQGCLTERAQVEKQLNEVDIMIRQSTAEVDKLGRRNAEITNRLRQIESNFDTVPRSDIQNIYNAYVKEQGRLFVMRGQLEKLQANQEGLQKRAELLDQVVSVLEQAGSQSMGAVSPVTGYTPEQSMVVRIIEAQENERQRLSRQMHDGPAQRLTNVILQAEICQRLLDSDPARARVELENLKEEVNKTFQKTRTFIADLRPMMLDDLGLVPTLRRYVANWKDKTGTGAELTVTGNEHRLAPYCEVTIFRAIQQLMENVEQHANPSHVLVAVQLDGQTVRAMVEDDGVGFDIDEVLAQAGARKTIGIASIIDRVEMLGGSLTFDSARGRGTKAMLEVPEN